MPDVLEDELESKIDVNKRSFAASKSYSSKKSTSAAVQCKGITKKGARCKRKTTNENGYCWQHQVQAEKTKTIVPVIKLGNSGTTVYITKTGKKYHSANCSSLRRSKIPISLTDAKKRGYTACSRCKPAR